jgi:hypothetical protein
LIAALVLVAISIFAAGHHRHRHSPGPGMGPMAMAPMGPQGFAPMPNMPYGNMPYVMYGGFARPPHWGPPMMSDGPCGGEGFHRHGDGWGPGPMGRPGPEGPSPKD